MFIREFWGKAVFFGGCISTHWKIPLKKVIWQRACSSHADPGSGGLGVKGSRIASMMTPVQCHNPVVTWTYLFVRSLLDDYFFIFFPWRGAGVFVHLYTIYVIILDISSSWAKICRWILGTESWLMYIQWWTTCGWNDPAAENRIKPSWLWPALIKWYQHLWWILGLVTSKLEWIFTVLDYLVIYGTMKKQLKQIEVTPRQETVSSELVATPTAACHLSVRSGTV